MPVKLHQKITPDLPTAAAAIKEMHAYYKETMRPGDSTSGWVSLQEIEALVKDNTINGVVPNGIRILYGRHNKSTLEALGFEYKDKHNVILIATYDANTGNPQTESSPDLLGDENFVSVSLPYLGMGIDAIPLCPPRCPNEINYNDLLKL
jgi:hypothetical protein